MVENSIFNEKKPRLPEDKRLLARFKHLSGYRMFVYEYTYDSGQEVILGQYSRKRRIWKELYCKNEKGQWKRLTMFKTEISTGQLKENEKEHDCLYRLLDAKDLILELL